MEEKPLCCYSGHKICQNRHNYLRERRDMVHSREPVLHFKPYLYDTPFRNGHSSECNPEQAVMC